MAARKNAGTVFTVPAFETVKKVFLTVSNAEFFAKPCLRKKCRSAPNALAQQGLCGYLSKLRRGYRPPHTPPRIIPQIRFSFSSLTG